jgi:hypothetical protein
VRDTRNVRSNTHKRLLLGEASDRSGHIADLRKPPSAFTSLGFTQNILGNCACTCTCECSGNIGMPQDIGGRQIDAHTFPQDQCLDPDLVTLHKLS